MEHYNYKGNEIVGIDHGFGNMKCRHVVFRSGVRAYDTEPPMTMDALYYEGKYYVVGEDHKTFVNDKSQDVDLSRSEMNVHFKSAGDLTYNAHLDKLAEDSAAELLSFCKNTVYKLIRDKELPCRRIGSAIRIRKNDVVNFMRQ